MFACREAASSMIAKELCDREEPTEATHGCPKATHGHPKARRVEYSAETADIRIVHLSKVPTSRKPADSGAENQQSQLNEIQNCKSSSQQAPKHDRGQSEHTPRNVYQAEGDRRVVKLGGKVDTGKSGEQVDRSHKKILGLQEYRDQRKNKKKVAEAAGLANNQEEKEDWDADLTSPPCLPSLELKVAEGAGPANN